MKVLAVVSSLMGGGAERQMVLLLQHLDRDRFQPTLCLLSGAQADYIDEVPPDVPVVDLGKQRPLDFFAITWRLATLVRSGQFGVVYSRVDYTNLVSVLASRLARTGTPTVVVEDAVQSLELADRRDRHIRQAVVGWTYRHATAVVAPTPGVGREVAAQLGRSGTRTFLIPNMVDVSSTRVAADEPSAHPFLGSRTPCAVAVGRLDRSKGFDTLLRALAILDRRTPCNLLVLGEGSERPYLTALAAELGIAERVDFVGFMKNPFSVIARSDVFVCSSRRESFGNVLIEAMALGKPIVSTDAPHGPSYLMRDGVNGLVAKVEDPQDLAEKIELLLGDGALASSLGTAARDFAEDFDAARLTRECEDVLATAAALPAGRPRPGS